MISFIISVGLFAIGVVSIIIAVFAAALIAMTVFRWMTLNKALIIMSVIVVSGLTVREVMADSIDLGNTFYSKVGYPDTNLSIGMTKTINKLFSVKAGVDQNVEGYLMGRIEKGDEFMRIGVNFGIVNQPDYNEVHKSFGGEHGVTIIRTVDSHKSKYIYAVIPTITFKANRHALELGIMPTIEKSQSTRITLTYQYTL